MVSLGLADCQVFVVANCTDASPPTSHTAVDGGKVSWDSSGVWKAGPFDVGEYNLEELESIGFVNYQALAVKTTPECRVQIFANADLTGKNLTLPIDQHEHCLVTEFGSLMNSMRVTVQPVVPSLPTLVPTGVPSAAPSLSPTKGPIRA